MVAVANREEFKRFVREAFAEEYRFAANAAPEFRKSLFAALVEKAIAFRTDLHPRGDDGRFVPPGVIRRAAKDPAFADKAREKIPDPVERQKFDDAVAGDTHHSLLGSDKEVAKHEAGEAKAAKVASRDEARRLRDKISLAVRSGEPLDAKDLRDIIPHLETLTHAELSKIRDFLKDAGASFGGTRLREDRIAALTAWASRAAVQADNAKLPPFSLFSGPRQRAIRDGAKNAAEDAGVKVPAKEEAEPVPEEKPAPKEGEPGFTGTDSLGRKWVDGELVKVLKPDTNRGPRRVGKVDSVLQQVVDYGGIDPNSHDFLKNYDGMKSARENGVPMGAFRTGGMGLDVLAQQLVSSGHISVPPNKDPGEHVLDLLRDKAYTLSADLSEEYDRAYEEHALALEYAGADHSAAEIAEAVRDGEAAGRAEGAADPLGQHGEGAGAPGSQVDFWAEFEDPAANSPQPAPAEPAPAPAKKPRNVATPAANTSADTTGGSDVKSDRAAERAYQALPDGTPVVMNDGREGVIRKLPYQVGRTGKTALRNHVQIGDQPPFAYDKKYVTPKPAPALSVPTDTFRA